MSTCGNAELIEHINKHAKYMLFMSVDIIDSTKTKQEIAKRNDKRTTTSDNYEVWIESFEQFFEDFQSDFKECLENSSFFNAADNVDIKIINKPNLWKCNGDEMIFCVQVTNHIHVPYYLDSFKRAIENHHVSKDKN